MGQFVDVSPFVLSAGGAWPVSRVQKRTQSGGAEDSIHAPTRAQLQIMKKVILTARTGTPPAGSLSSNRRMIRKLSSGEYRLYSRKKNPKTGKRRNLGTFASREKAEAHERAVQYFKRH
jgi:hypothetical protein